LNTILAITIAVLVGGWILIAVVGSRSVLSMSRARLKPLEGPQKEAALSKVISSGVVDTAWLSAHGFQPLGAYRVEQMPAAAIVVAWNKDGERTYLCAYLVAGADPMIDFVTIFEGSQLTTGKSKDGQLLPASPNTFMQTFTATTAVLWRRHEEGLAVLSRLRGLVPLHGGPHLEEDFAAAMHSQTEHIRSLPLWPLRIPGWYFIRRHMRHETPIAKMLRSR
jgi:hypothetical protein